MTEDMLGRWIGEETVTRVTLCGHWCLALLDTRATINLVTPKFAAKAGMIGPLKDLGAKGNCTIGITTGKSTQPLSYAVFHIQVHGVSGYDEEQVMLMMADASEFARHVSVVHGLLP